MTVADVLKNANFGQYLEKEIVSKRFILAMAIVGYYIYSQDTTAAGLVGSVMGFYFGEKAATKQPSADVPAPVAYVTEKAA